MLALLLGGVTWGAGSRAQGATLEWAGHRWEVTSGGMAGVCEGNPANVSVDDEGYLHLRISHEGGTWSASELFTTDRLGFGTYQWQLEGPIDTYDKNVVLGLFPYGPAAGIGSDGTNEIDIEYSRWGQVNGPNGDYTDYPASGRTIGEESYTFSLSGLTSTSRFVWSSTEITDFLFDGFEPLATSAEPLKTWTYAPSTPSTNIPQVALPLGMNLWCFDAPPSDGAPVEIVVHGFEFVAEGAAGAGGMMGGTAGTGDAGGGPNGGGGAMNAGGEPNGGGGRGGMLSDGGASGGRSGVAGAVNTAGRASGPAGASGAALTADAGAAGAAGRDGASGTATEPLSPPVSKGATGCSCSLENAGSSRACSALALLVAAWLARCLRRPSATSSASKR
jgi:hypothetical protein